MEECTDGKAPREKARETLKKSDAGYHLEPGRNTLTEEEIRSTTIGTYPDMANGWALLDTGTASLDKVRVKNGELVDADLGIMTGMVIMAGRIYYVEGRVLPDSKPQSSPGSHLPDTPDMACRKDLAGQTVEQKTASGPFLVTYDDLGYAVKSSRK